MAVMYLCLPVTTTACAIQVYLSLSVELMVSPTSHLAEQAARNTTLMETQMCVQYHELIIILFSTIFASFNQAGTCL